MAWSAKARAAALLARSHRRQTISSHTTSSGSGNISLSPRQARRFAISFFGGVSGQRGLKLRQSVRRNEQFSAAALGQMRSGSRKIVKLSSTELARALGRRR
jgi:hypothetical protein